MAEETVSLNGESDNTGFFPRFFFFLWPFVCLETNHSLLCPSSFIC